MNFRFFIDEEACRLGKERLVEIPNCNSSNAFESVDSHILQLNLRALNICNRLLK